MRHKRTLLTGVGVIVGLPLVVVVGVVAWYLLSDRTNGSIVSSGDVRDYVLHVPETYDPARPAPLVISLHGTMLWPGLQRDISGWNELADRQGFIVVYPGALGRPERKWQLLPGDTLEVRYISDLIDRVDDTYRIDRSRVYADGLSAGGILALDLACRLPERIAAVAAVAAILPADWCDEPQPVPLIAFHGTDDPLIPYEGGRTWAADVPFESVPDWIAGRARQNRCSPVPIETRVSDRTIRRDYRGCAASLIHYVIDGGGHQWPGGMQFPEWMGGPASDGIDATDAIWQFFSEHELRAD